MENVRFLPCGDQAVTVEWGSTLDEHINRQVHAFARKVEALSHPAITEVVPLTARPPSTTGRRFFPMKS